MRARPRSAQGARALDGTIARGIRPVIADHVLAAIGAGRPPGDITVCHAADAGFSVESLSDACGCRSGALRRTGRGGVRHVRPGEAPPEDAIVPIDVTEITLSVAPGVHGNSPVRVDLVRVTDEGEFKQLLQTDAAEWFADGARTFIDTHPDARSSATRSCRTEVGPFEVRVDEVSSACCSARSPASTATCSAWC